MAGEIASAYLTIYPKLDSKSVAAEVERAMGGASSSVTSSMGRVGQAGGSALAEGFSAAKVAVGNIISDIATSAAQQLTDAFGDGVAQSDALKKFFSTMQFAGLAADEIQVVEDAMRDYADQTVYDLNDILTTTAKLASNGVADYETLVQAMGNLNAAAGGDATSFGFLANAITQVNGAGRLMSQDWNQIVNALPGASGAIQDELLAMGAWDESMGTFKDALAAGEITAEEFNQAITNLGMTDVAREAATSTSTFEGAMGQFEAAVTNTMMEVYDALNEDGRITEFINGLASAFEAAVPYVTAIADAIGDFVQAIAPALPIIAGIAAGIAAASALTAVIGAITGAITVFTTVIAPALAMVGSVPGLVALVMSVIGGPIPIIMAVIGAIVAFIATNEDARKAVVTAFNQIRSTVTNVLGAVKNAVQSAMDNIKSFFTDAMNSVRDTVTRELNSVSTAFTTLKTNVTNALSGAASWLVSAGEDIIQGLINGINNATSWVTSAVQSVCSNAIGTLKSFFGIASPSKLMAEMGEYMMQGLADGIEDGTGMATRAMTDASADVAGALGIGGASYANTRTSAATATGGLVDEVRALHEDVRNLRVYLDTGALVGGISGQMDGALGRRAAYAGRGVV